MRSVKAGLGEMTSGRDFFYDIVFSIRKLEVFAAA